VGVYRGRDIMTEIITSINKCNELLKKLITTCCEGQKSLKMNELVSSLREASLLNSSNADEIIQISKTCGSIIGELHVSCCVNGKEILYREILTELNKIYINAWKLKS
jgi:hypothetical protein